MTTGEDRLRVTGQRIMRLSQAKQEIRDPELLKSIVAAIRRFFDKDNGAFTSNGVVRSVKCKVTTAYNAWCEEAAYTDKLPTLAECLMLRYCSGDGSLNSMVGGRLCEMGRGDLLYVRDGYLVSQT